MHLHQRIGKTEQEFQGITTTATSSPSSISSRLIQPTLEKTKNFLIMPLSMSLSRRWQPHHHGPEPPAKSDVVVDDSSKNFKSESKDAGSPFQCGLDGANESINWRSRCSRRTVPNDYDTTRKFSFIVKDNIGIGSDDNDGVVENMNISEGDDEAKYNSPNFSVPSSSFKTNKGKMAKSASQVFFLPKFLAAATLSSSKSCSLSPSTLLLILGLVLSWMSLSSSVVFAKIQDHKEHQRPSSSSYPS
ncbi:unnamed protein product [Orchesella dallaii]|uniref:Uncharacterized protein n=1 Tax=Orchesella dallaii TaxID=48710 RepID=A0ABP1RZE3_9HEXA